MKSILFDSTFRSGNHFTIALLKKSFPDINLYWGFKYQHNPESFNLSKDKFDYYMTVIRKPIDSIASQVLISSKEDINEIIIKYKLFLESVLNNKDKIHIYSFEDLINNPIKIIENIANELNIKFYTVDIDKLIKSFYKYNTQDFYVVPINNKDKLVEIKLKLSEINFFNLIKEIDELYNKLLIFKIKIN
jgi:hypothetical protein